MYIMMLYPFLYSRSYFRNNMSYIIIIFKQTSIHLYKSLFLMHISSISKKDISLCEDNTNGMKYSCHIVSECERELTV